jgi:DNA-binding transcriptional LysR family regulator
VKLAFLSTLDTVLRRGSFAAGAQEIGLTASAVSLQMKELERYFGQPLFDRSARTARPTSFAWELSSAIHDALSTIEGLRVKRGSTVSGRAALGTIRSVQTTTLPAALLEVKTRFPDLSLRLVQDASPLLLHSLKAGDLDAAIVVRPQSGGSSRLSWVTLAHEPFVLLAPMSSKSNSIRELLQTHAWIGFDTTLTGGRIAAAFVQRLAPRTRSILDMGSIESIAAMVSAGVGVSVVPRLRGPLRNAYPVRELSLGKKAPTREIAFVCRLADKENRRVLALRECFERIYMPNADRRDNTTEG